MGFNFLLPIESWITYATVIGDEASSAPINSMHINILYIIIRVCDSGVIAGLLAR